MSNAPTRRTIRGAAGPLNVVIERPNIDRPVDCDAVLARRFDRVQVS